jgi:hypothetical protein
MTSAASLPSKASTGTDFRKLTVAAIRASDCSFPVVSDGAWECPASARRQWSRTSIFRKSIVQKATVFARPRPCRTLMLDAMTISYRPDAGEPS